MTSWSYSVGEIEQSHEFVGTIRLIDESIITYKLSFVEKADGTITGKSITDFSGAHRTETAIAGSIDREAGTLTFNERYNISTKSDVVSSNFCYVHVYDAKIKLKGEKSIIQGHFYSRYADGSKCIEGDLYLMGDQYFYNKLKSVSNKKLLPNSKKQVLKKMLKTSEENMKRSVMKEGDELIVYAQNNDLMIRLWDNEHIDGDRISVYRDDRIILEKYAVKRAQKQLLIPITKDTTVIKVVADNEGRIPPNSAKFEILNSSIDVPVLIRLNTGKEVKFIVIKDQ